MTTFTDRENAIEAHHALLELAAFQRRVREYRELGLRVATRLDLKGSAAKQFAAAFAEHLVLRITKDDLQARIAGELSLYDFELSAEDIRRLTAGEESVRQVREITPEHRSWIEFLVGQFLMLFGAEPHSERKVDPEPG